MNQYSNSLITDFRFKIYHKFLKALKEYDLIHENDKIMVCISGGKDSFIMALCFKEISKWSDFPFETKFVVMNPGYKKEDLDLIKDNASKLEIDIEIYDTKIFKIAESQEDKKCYICAKMRRGALYNHAKEIGCNKIALGHHFNDVIETTLLSILYAGKIETMLPEVKSDNYEGLSLIRPMYLVKEDDIIDYAKTNNLKFMKAGCFITNNESLCSNSRRKYVKNLIQELKKDNDNADINIFRSMENVNIDKVVGYKKDGVIHTLKQEKK